MIQELNEKNFDEMTKDGLKFVVFTAPWCGFCMKQKPVLEELSKNNIWIGNVNGDDNPNLTNRFGIQAFPSFILFKQGKPVTKFSGYKQKYDLMNLLTGFLNK